MDEKVREIRTKWFSEITSLDLAWLYTTIDELEKNNKSLSNDLLQQIELTQGRVKKLVDENECYKEALEKLRKYSMSFPLDREEDGSPVEEETTRVIYEVTTEALKGESE